MLAIQPAIKRENRNWALIIPISDDESFTREFTADGKVVDRYTGDSSADEIGAYTTVDTSKEIIEDVPADLLEDVHVIKLSFSETDLYFSVVTLTQNELELGFIGRGNTLSFKRLK